MKWVLPEPVTEEVILNLPGFSKIEQQLLFNKGITNTKAAENFFQPLRSELNPAKLLPNSAAAAQRILEAVKNKEQIHIYGDYDVDGVTSTAILFDFLFRKLKAQAMPYIPDRFEEGYGLGAKGLDHILEAGGKLVISVDCGIRDAKLVQEYSKKGLEFIITDHHAIPTEEGELAWPKAAVATVHPGLDPEYPFPQICACAVTWKLIEVLAELAVTEKITPKRINTDKYLDLVALATICDIMPIIGENRVLVAAGLELVRSGKANPGLKSLMNQAQIEPADFDAYHFGFIIGPRLNAAGRIEHALDGVRLLTSTNKRMVEQVAVKLDELNHKRQTLTQTILEAALHEAEAQVERGEALVFVYGKDWSEGVVGLVASRLNERFHKPVLVANLNEKEGIVKGSARSITGFDITAAISQSKDLLLKYGGHNQAAGFTLEVANLDDFIANLQALAGETITKEQSEMKLQLDASLEHEDIIMQLAEFIEKMKPFGYGNREPVFCFKGLKVWGDPKLLGREKKHLKFTVNTKDNLFLDVIAFNQGDKIDIITKHQTLDLAGTLDINSWNGNRKLQIKLKDFHEAGIQ